MDFQMLVMLLPFIKDPTAKAVITLAIVAQAVPSQLKALKPGETAKINLPFDIALPDSMEIPWIPVRKKLPNEGVVDNLPEEMQIDWSLLK